MTRLSLQGCIYSDFSFCPLPAVSPESMCEWCIFLLINRMFIQV
ncbi:hypothetical protein [Morganella morganii IS15]|nr:hypothetical protein [Morganella morganii IS15]